jgi:TRAP transporter TAXI family solute receptor
MWVAEGSDAIGLRIAGGDMTRRARAWAASAWLVSVAVAWAGCGQTGGPAAKQRLSIATGGTGGVYYPYGGGIAKVLSEHLPGVEATAEVTAASVDNLKFLSRGTSDIAFTMADTAQDGVAGRDMFEEFGAVPARALAVLYPNHTHLVTLANTGIAKVADLRGRVVSIGAPGAGTAVVAERILTAAGLDPRRDIDAQTLGVAQSVDALKDGKIEAFFWSGGLPTAAILDLVNTPGITAALIPLDELLPALRRAHGESLYYRTVIPRAVYRLREDVPVIAVANLLVVSDSMSESLAYDITRVIFEHQAVLAGIHPQARELSAERALTGASIPFHPGAIRYYRERGVWKEP